MSWHELLSLTPELKRRMFLQSVSMFFKELVKKFGEAYELKFRWGNFYDTINFTKTK